MPMGIKLHGDQMTLGDFRQALSELPPAARVWDGNRRTSHPYGFGSYRGYYEDACLMVGEKTVITVSELRWRLDEFMRGKSMNGYKGGVYTVRADTPLWIDEYSRASGRYVTGLKLNTTATIVRVMSRTEDE